jgi:hypothetical protein
MNLREGEELIIEGVCLYHRGVIAHSIKFILTSKKLWFAPVGLFDRLVVKEVTLLLDSIENVQISGIDKFVSLQTEGSTYRFSQMNASQLHGHLKAVLQEKKGRGEKRLTQDKCLYHRGIIAHPVDVVLTTERVFFYSTNFRDRLFGMRDQSISTRALLSVETKGVDQMVILKTEKQKLRFSGSGAKRMLPMYRKIIQFYQNKGDPSSREKLKPVLAQGGIDFFVLGPISIKGEFILNRDELKLTSYKSISTKIFGEINLTIPLKEGLRFLENSTKQKLGFKYRDQTIWLGGNKVTVIHFFLRQLNSYS